MLNGDQFRLYPHKAQQQSLRQGIGSQRLIYTAQVQEDRYYRRFPQRMVGTAGEESPLDQAYSRFITERTAFLRTVPSQILRNGAVQFRQAYSRVFQKRGSRPKLQKKTGRQAVWITQELCEFLPHIDDQTGEIGSYPLTLGTDTFPVGVIPDVAHRSHAVPASIHIAVDGGHWGLSFAAEDPTAVIPGRDADAATERMAEDGRHLSANQLAERTLGGDRGIAKPLVTSDGQIFDLQPMHKDRIRKAQRQRKKWPRRASRRKKGSTNRRKAQQKAARYQRYEKNGRHEYAHQTSHQWVVNDTVDLYVFEDLKIRNMTQRPKATRDAQGRFLPNGRNAKAGLSRAILASARGDVGSFTRYKALRRGKLVITVPPQHRSQECAVCTFTSPDHRRSQAEFVCQHCGHRDNADHNAAVVIAQRGITKLLSGIPRTKKHKPTRLFPRQDRENFRKFGPERSEVTPGEIAQDAQGHKPAVQRSMSQERPASYTVSTGGAIPDTPASTREG